MATTSKFHPPPLTEPHTSLNLLDFFHLTPAPHPRPPTPSGTALAHASAIIDRLTQ